MEVTGTIKVINDVKQISDKFKAQTFVLTTSGEYPQHIELQLANAKCDLMRNFKVGDNITCSIELRGREYTNQTSGEVRYFNTISVWKIALSTVGKDTPSEAPSEQSAAGDDLPF